MSSASTNAASAALDALRRCPCKPERHGPLLVWRADVTELLSPSTAAPPPPALARLLDDVFRRRFAAAPDALPDVAASAYTPGAVFDNNLATVSGTPNIAAAWRFLAAPFVSVGVVDGGRPARVEVVAWAPAAAAAAATAATANPPASGTFAEEEEQEQPTAAPLPTRPPLNGAVGVALVVETEQHWRLARALVLVRTVFGDDVRVVVTSTLRLSRATGKVAGHADRVEGWWAVPKALRAVIGAAAPIVSAVLGW